MRHILAISILFFTGLFLDACATRTNIDSDEGFNSKAVANAMVSQGVTVSSPGNSATVSSPFNLIASAPTCSSQAVSAIGYSLDSSSNTTIIKGTSVNTTVSSSMGTHILHVKSWGNNGSACHADVNLTVAIADTSSSTYPVSIPAGALSYPSLEQSSGWVSAADSSISPHPPSIYTISQSGSPVEMTLNTKGTSGLYTGWMAHKTISTSGQLHMLLRASYSFNSVSGIQAWELGRRSTNSKKITDNGQTQLVPKSGGVLEFDIVPSASGGWKDTGCRFPTFVANTTYNEELYYVDDSSGALSLMYISLNGNICKIPSSLQSIGGASLGWGANGAVVAFQPDANPSAVAFKAVVKMGAWAW